MVRSGLPWAATAFAAAATIPQPAPSSKAPVPAHQLSRWQASSTGGSLGSRPTISPTTLPLSVRPSERGLSSSVSVNGLAPARAIMRARLSASGLESAAAGVGATPAGKVVPPVCGVRSFSVPIERITVAIAPFRAASPGPVQRTGPAKP
jgi:hypothetical protein